jgi:hypothetical protein
MVAVLMAWALPGYGLVAYKAAEKKVVRRAMLNPL